MHLETKLYIEVWYGRDKMRWFEMAWFLFELIVFNMSVHAYRIFQHSKHLHRKSKINSFPLASSQHQPHLMLATRLDWYRVKQLRRPVHQGVLGPSIRWRLVSLHHSNLEAWAAQNNAQNQTPLLALWKKIGLVGYWATSIFIWCTSLITGVVRLRYKITNINWEKKSWK